MAWRDDLRPASFRGVPFGVRRAELDGGRRGALHEYPQRDAPYFEDLGHKARDISIVGFVVGDDYFARRDALEAALKQAGPGELVHPYRGALMLQPRSYRVLETWDKGRMARFTLRFIEPGENAFPAAATDTRRTVRDRADTASTTAQTSFKDAFGVGKRPAFIAADAVAMVVTIANAIAAIAGTVVAGDSQVADDAGDLAARAPSLVFDSGALGQEVAGLAAAIAAPAPLIELAGFGEDVATVAPVTPNRTLQEANRAALIRLTRRVALIEGARAAAGVNFAALQDAIDLRDNLAGRLDAEVIVAGAAREDAAVAAMIDLRSATIRDLTVRAAELPRLVGYTPPDTRPILAIAYRVHGDAGRGEEIRARNLIRDPGFVTGGRELRVLVNG